MFNFVMIFLFTFLLTCIGSFYKIPHTSFNDCLIYASIGVFCHEFAELKNKIEKA